MRPATSNTRTDAGPLCWSAEHHGRGLVERVRERHAQRGVTGRARWDAARRPAPAHGSGSHAPRRWRCPARIAGRLHAERHSRELALARDAGADAEQCRVDVSGLRGQHDTIATLTTEQLARRDRDRLDHRRVVRQLRAHTVRVTRARHLDHHVERLADAGQRRHAQAQRIGSRSHRTRATGRHGHQRVVDGVEDQVLEVEPVVGERTASTPCRLRSDRRPDTRTGCPPASVTP